jgi:hypothetical protein
VSCRIASRAVSVQKPVRAGWRSDTEKYFHFAAAIAVVSTSLKTQARSEPVLPRTGKLSRIFPISFRVPPGVNIIRKHVHRSACAGKNRRAALAVPINFGARAFRAFTLSNHRPLPPFLVKRPTGKTL